ncbi:MAG: hypothetical protein M1825_002970 [Sarcosagium campestre]|nr:MAG: hypothetical protein M1825_002970 [Sarcosagium campestre]
MKTDMTFVSVSSRFLLAALVAQVSAHSWVEQLTVIAPNGTFVGAPGYPRGNILRTSPGFNDPAMVNLLPPNGRPNGNKILDSDKMCKDSQSSPQQTDGSPALKAGPGSMIALRYQENGHVTIPDNTPGKPENRGWVYIYGTKDPQPTDTMNKIFKVWNADGTGGDKRGKLIAKQPYDDGRCYQVNGRPISTTRVKDFPHTADKDMGMDLWCQNNIALPKDLKDGEKYTLYWVWDWPTAPGAGLPEGKAERYTTCMDIDVTGESTVKSASADGYVDQDLSRSAIPSYVKELMSGGSGGESDSGDSGKAPKASPSKPPSDQEPPSDKQPKPPSSSGGQGSAPSFPAPASPSQSCVCPPAVAAPAPAPAAGGPPAGGPPAAAVPPAGEPAVVEIPVGNPSGIQTAMTVTVTPLVITVTTTVTATPDSGPSSSAAATSAAESETKGSSEPSKATARDAAAPPTTTTTTTTTSSSIPEPTADETLDAARFSNKTMQIRHRSFRRGSARLRL